MPRSSAIYLETSTLWPLPLDLENARFLNLKELSGRLGIPILTTRLSVDEYLHNKANELLTEASSLGRVLEKLKDFIHEPTKLTLPSDLPSILAELEQRFAASLHKHGVEVVPNATVPQDTLLNMSLKRTRPFEEKGEKGFRDTVILYTLLHDAKSRHFDSVALMSGDQVFSHEHVTAIAIESGIALRILGSFESAIAYLNELQSAEFREWLSHRMANLRAFLLEHNTQILEFIKENVLVDEPFLTSGEAVFGVNEILAVELTDIENPLPGFLTGGVEEGRIKVAFLAKLRIRFSAKPFVLPPPVQLPLREGASAHLSALFGALMAGTASSLEEGFVDHVVERDVPVTASVNLREETEEYSNLTLESAGPGGRIAAILRRLPPLIEKVD